MNSYLFDTELVRIALLFGVVFSMLFYSRYGVTTGGAIIPGYFALFVLQPTHIAVTLILAVITHRIVQQQLRPRFMLWGRQLFEAEILVALALQCIWVGGLLLLTAYTQQVTLLYGIGFLLPGIIAHDMGRQGIKTTIGAALLGALVVFGLISLIGALRDLFHLSTTGLDLLYHARSLDYAYPVTWLMVGIVISVLASIILFHFRLFDFGTLTDSPRTGGFVTAGYLALFANRPLDLLFILLGSGLTYLLVTRILMRQAILFGRSKMAAMFLMAMLVTWLLEILIVNSGYAYTPWAGFSAITPTMVALLANDAQRQGVAKTLVGVTLLTLIVVAMMALLQRLFL